MKDRLPEFIDPIRLAGKGERLQGQVSLDNMDRLKTMLASDYGQKEHGQIEYQLDFGIDRSGNKNIRGKITAQVEVTCQRCLKTMAYQVDTRVMLGIVLSKQQADQLPDKYEPLVLDSALAPGQTTQEVSLTDIIEDEMILAMPATPMHAPGECDSGALVEKYVAREEPGEQKRENPFAVLETLKNKD